MLCRVPATSQVESLLVCSQYWLDLLLDSFYHVHPLLVAAGPFKFKHRQVHSDSVQLSREANLKRKEKTSD